MRSKKILLVDDEPNNLRVLREILIGDGYLLYFAKSGEKALESTEKHHPDLILMDIQMPKMDGYETCRKIKSNPDSCSIPVIFVSTMSNPEDETRGFEAGAVDYITKPVSAPIVRARIRNHLSLVQMGELEKSQKDAITMLATAGHYNDTDTGAHIWRMADYSAMIAQHYGWDDERTSQIRLAALMHDTGKIGTPDEILKAPRKLTPEERVIMEQHAENGYFILSQTESNLFTMAAEIALNHHEKWDGSGYPNGLEGDDIPESARIVALADVFDALTMKRPYKEAWTDEDAVKEIVKGSGQHFDPKAVEIFVSILPKLQDIRLRWSDSDRFDAALSNKDPLS